VTSQIMTFMTNKKYTVTQLNFKTQNS